MHTQQKATNIFKAQIFQAICQECENRICSSSVVLTDTSMKGVANSERSKKDGGGDNG